MLNLAYILHMEPINIKKIKQLYFTCFICLGTLKVALMVPLLVILMRYIVSMSQE